MMKVACKIDELSVALDAACSTKFCNKHAAGLMSGMNALLEGKCDSVAKTTELLKEIEAAVSFTPVTKTQIMKGLGEKKGVAFLERIQDNKDYYTKLSQAMPSLLSLLQSPQPSDLGPASLMDSNLIAFIEVMQNDKVLENVRKILPRATSPLSRLQEKIVAAAKDVVVRHGSSFLAFISKLKDVDSGLDSFMDENVVGKVVETDGEEEILQQVNYGKMFEIYFAKVDAEMAECNYKEIIVDLPTLCSAACLLPLCGHLLHVKTIVDQISGKASLVEKLIRLQNPAVKLLEETKIENITAAWTRMVAAVGLFFFPSGRDCG